MYKKLKHFQFFSPFFQALSTPGHLLLPSQRTERIRGVKAEKRQWQELLRSQTELPTSLCLRSRRTFTRTRCSTDRPVTCWELEPGNKVPNCWHSKCHSHPQWEHHTSTRCHYQCAQRAGAIRLLAIHKSRAAFCEAEGRQPNETHSAQVMADASHTHSLIQIPLMSL